MIDGHQKSQRIICSFNSVTNTNHLEMRPVLQGCPYPPTRRKHKSHRSDTTIEIDLLSLQLARDSMCDREYRMYRQLKSFSLAHHFLSSSFLLINDLLISPFQDYLLKMIKASKEKNEEQMLNSFCVYRDTQHGDSVSATCVDRFHCILTKPVCLDRLEEV